MKIEDQTKCLMLSLPNDPQYGVLLRKFVSWVAMLEQFDVKAIEDIEWAVDEAFTNALQHGVPTVDGQEVITICIYPLQDSIEITVHDSGNGFDPEAVKCRQEEDARDCEFDLAECGRGLDLIAASMDVLHYDRVPDGTRVRMVKHRRTEAEGT